jgi:hypothetical protein
VVEAISVKKARSALPAGSGYAALERGDQETLAEPAAAIASQPSADLLPEAASEQELADEQ